ncbi:hypothetical protein E2C01_017423 [Portunus trituberculatus]|uniref:Uncharacterized protein n=1 Tax=Portunus trituberculatus TaxID=210409 RepID=A0A5B7DTN1_PORTR|nr:hypothetical protein [Portunus trituberculatus]
MEERKHHSDIDHLQLVMRRLHKGVEVPKEYGSQVAQKIHGSLTATNKQGDTNESLNTVCHTLVRDFMLCPGIIRV